VKLPSARSSQPRDDSRDAGSAHSRLCRRRMRGNRPRQHRSAARLRSCGAGVHLESVPRPFGGPAVEGYVCNEGLRWLSNVRLRVEVLDPDGTAVEEALGGSSATSPPWSRTLRRSGPQSGGGPASECQETVCGWAAPAYCGWTTPMRDLIGPNWSEKRQASPGHSRR
jgi:hypothetical protein